jgi:hypothetical protein
MHVRAFMQFFGDMIGKLNEVVFPNTEGGSLMSFFVLLLRTFNDCLLQITLGIRNKAIQRTFLEYAKKALSKVP